METNSAGSNPLHPAPTLRQTRPTSKCGEPCCTERCYQSDIQRGRHRERSPLTSADRTFPDGNAIPFVMAISEARGNRQTVRYDLLQATLHQMLLRVG
jgi:hypothetical protein